MERIRPRASLTVRLSDCTTRESGLEDVEFATPEWVAWFNHQRLLEPIGHVPPVEHQEAYYRRQQAPAELVALT